MSNIKDQIKEGYSHLSEEFQKKAPQVLGTAKTQLSRLDDYLTTPGKTTVFVVEQSILIGVGLVCGILIGALGTIGWAASIVLFLWAIGKFIKISKIREQRIIDRLSLEQTAGIAYGAHLAVFGSDPKAPTESVIPSASSVSSEPQIADVIEATKEASVTEVTEVPSSVFIDKQSAAPGAAKFPGAFDTL